MKRPMFDVEDREEMRRNETLRAESLWLKFHATKLGKLVTEPIIKRLSKILYYITKIK